MGTQAIPRRAVIGLRLVPLDATMKQLITAWILAGAFFGLAARVQAQASGSALGPGQSVTQEPVHQDPVSVQVPLVNYHALGDAAKTEFSPTALTLNAKGLAEVEIKKEGSVSVKAQFSGLDSPTKFGNEFITYMLWAVTPKGQPLKIGELSVNGDSARLVASTVLRTFGMLVTAEPYAGVIRPSNVVVLAGKSMGATQPPSALCELLRDGYAPAGYKYEPIDTTSGYPPELVQALNARRIAKAVQADKYAAGSFRSAEGLYDYMISWVVHEKKTSKKMLQLAGSVTSSYEQARAEAMSQSHP